VYTQKQIPKRIHIPNKKRIKKKSQQIMVVNLCGKKMRTHEDDEVRYVFTPIWYSYNSNLKNILLWTSSGEEERACENKVGLIGLFEIEWKTPQHNILVEFLNNWKLDPEHKKIKIILGDE
jgi:hypothetical protein